MPAALLSPPHRKNKTLETFGETVCDSYGNPIPDTDGKPKRKPFHVYTMKQAIQEGFILDVLRHSTPIDSFYKLMKTVEDDPMFDKKRAQKKLRSFAEGNEFTIAKKAAMMVEHFHEQVIAKNKNLYSQPKMPNVREIFPPDKAI